MLGLNPFESALLILLGILIPPLGLVLLVICYNY